MKKKIQVILIYFSKVCGTQLFSIFVCFTFPQHHLPISETEPTKKHMFDFFYYYAILLRQHNFTGNTNIMQQKLKKNLCRTGIFAAVTAIFPLLYFPIWKFADVLERVLRYDWVIIPFLLYLLSAILVIIFGSTEVIWCLPLNKLWRTAIFILWLVIYPALCYAWLAACIYIFLFGIAFF